MANTFGRQASGVTLPCVGLRLNASKPETVLNRGDIFYRFPKLIRCPNRHVLSGIHDGVVHCFTAFSFRGGGRRGGVWCRLCVLCSLGICPRSIVMVRVPLALKGAWRRFQVSLVPHINSIIGIHKSFADYLIATGYCKRESSLVLRSAEI